MSSLRVLGELDANFAWDGARLYEDADLAPGTPVPAGLRGAAASASAGEGGAVRLLRDPLGINKLFWAEEGEVVSVAARPRTLVDAGLPFEQVWAFPRGAVLDRDGSQASHGSIDLSAGPGGASLEALATRIRHVLDGYLAAIASARPEAAAFVCISGGLDSSGIAALVREHFPAAVGVSFDLAGPGRRGSEDRLMARRLARDLGLELMEATVSEEELLEHLDTVLVEAIDWRDFNVHAGLVNTALAAEIDAAGGHGPALVFTGDLANEFLVDYEPEVHRGETYYELPTLPPEALRASLVRGLDSSHREVGVFGAWGLRVVQPYAAAVDAYLALPEAFLMREDRKRRLGRAVFGDLLPEYVYSRPKTRAQVGGEGGAGGVLAACVDRGLDGSRLRARFAELHGLADPSALDRFIRAGRYASGLPWER